MSEQDLTQNILPHPKTDGGVKPLTYWQDQYISFCATGGMITGEDGTVGTIDELGNVTAKGTMKTTEFAAMAGVSRTTLFNWQRSIPSFWDKVAARRKEIGSHQRVMKVWNGLYLKAAAGNPQAAALFLANYDPNFRMPAQKVEHEVGDSWGALLRAKAKLIDGVQEGEIIDGPSPN